MVGLVEQPVGDAECRVGESLATAFGDVARR